MNLGRIVLYRLASYDCGQIETRRFPLLRAGGQVPEPTFHGFYHSPGQQLPAIVVADLQPGFALQVFLAGNDTHFVPMALPGDDQGQYQPIPRM